MMKLILSLTLIWALSSTAGALDCQICTDLQCSTTVPQTCSSETMCVTASIRAASSGTPAQQIFKACASSSLCPATGSQTFSSNLGFASAVASATCCNTDNCNAGTLAFPAVQTNNSLQCFTCNPITSQCTTPLQCKGVEDSCFQGSATIGSSTSQAFGCASANLCSLGTIGSLGSLSSQISLLFNQSVTISGPSCCGTSLCNTVATTAAPTTAAPTTAAPTTAAPTTAAPTTVAPTTAAPTTAAPTTAAPTTAAPTTAAPTTVAPTTAAPTTAAPTTAAPTTAAPTTAAPTTAAPTTAAPTTAAPTTAAPTTAAPTTAAPTTAAPTTVAPTTAAPTSAAPTTAVTTTVAPTTAAPTTSAPTTETPTTSALTTATTASDACCIRLGMIHLLLGLLIFTFV